MKKTDMGGCIAQFHTYEHVDQDLWVQDCIHYSSILNSFCILSLPFHNIPWSLSHIWIYLFFFSSSLAFHLTEGAYIFTQSATGRHKLFLNCCSHSITTVKFFVQMSCACHQFISLEHRFLEWILGSEKCIGFSF